jgi:hypothetical protein
MRTVSWRADTLATRWSCKSRAPTEVMHVRPGREIRQSTVVDRATGKSYLVRVVVDVRSEADVIVTAYQTSRAARYRRRT